MQFDTHNPKQTTPYAEFAGGNNDENKQPSCRPKSFASCGSRTMSHCKLKPNRDFRSFPAGCFSSDPTYNQTVKNNFPFKSLEKQRVLTAQKIFEFF